MCCFGGGKIFLSTDMIGFFNVQPDMGFVSSLRASPEDCPRVNPETEVDNGSGC
jgi:hypothetical protein